MRWWGRFLPRGLLTRDAPPRAHEAPVKDEKEKEQRSGETDREADAAEKIGASVLELTRELAAFKNQLQTDNQTEQRERREYETGELYWTRIAAFAAIVFSFLSIVLSGLTLVVLDKTLEVYRGQAEMMRVTERAYVYARPMTVTDFEPNKAPTIQINLDNKGLTPAYGLTLRSWAAIGIYPVSFEKLQNIEQHLSLSTLPTEMTVFPNIANMNQFETLPIQLSDTIAAIKDGTDRIYVWGHVAYTDAYRRRRFSNFCFMFGGKGWEANTFNACPYHNDAN